MIASTFVCTLVALLVLSVRTYTRLKVVRNFGWDVSRAAQLSRSYDLFFSLPDADELRAQDCIMCLAMLLSVTVSTMVVIEACNGGGRHIGDVPSEIYMVGMKMNVIAQPICVFAVAIVKLSIGMALLRIAGHTSWRYLIITIMTIMGSWAFSSIFVSQTCETFHSNEQR